jgi:hypothetical protein
MNDHSARLGSGAPDSARDRTSSVALRNSYSGEESPAELRRPAQFGVPPLPIVLRAVQTAVLYASRSVSGTFLSLSSSAFCASLTRSKTIVMEPGGGRCIFLAFAAARIAWRIAAASSPFPPQPEATVAPMQTANRARRSRRFLVRARAEEGGKDALDANHGS